MDIKIQRTTKPKTKPDQKALGFGKYLTDHMFLMDYNPEQGWHDFRIVPYRPIPMEPDAVALHYAQETFEGLKAYRYPDGSVHLFRPDMNAKRLINSNKRLCMPEVPVDLFVEACKAIVRVDEDWVPSEPGTSLYIRPFMFTSEGQIALHNCTRFTFAIILSPVGAYFAEGINPVKILVEDEYVRAVKGGTGFAKCGGNYAGAMIGQEKAEKLGYSQVLWLDGAERKYVEEAGGMNFVYSINGEFWTAPTEGTVLPGITRDSILHILRDWGVTVREERMDIDTLMAAGHDGSLKEAFACGTAAVISPVGALNYKGDEVTINNFTIGELTQKLYDYLTGIQWGKEADKYGWTVAID
ncbi:branched-chain amino acid aminotransferase [uncultured Anaerovibrio sp.]|uniref:branched-chain amino acid aminotransferase n=1 Tax=uncultured Anaerovibrio sp. TaxID=361586 RepID=UPI0025D61B04|nr:branched-chain amino acid aminotransferase [uncultured Anaerovibrio sp.]